MRHFALRRLLDLPEEAREVRAARKAIMRSQPVRAILDAQSPEGWWTKPGCGYGPKCRGADWQILFLAEFGADGRNRQVRRGCEYLLDHAPAAHGGFSVHAGAAPNGAVHCLNGNSIWALVALGCGEDARVRRAVDWLAGSITARISTGGTPRPSPRRGLCAA